MHAARFHPYPHVPRVLRQLVAARLAPDRVDRVVVEVLAGQRDATDPDEVADAIEEPLRVRAEIVVEQHQHAFAAEALEPIVQMKRVAVDLGNVGTRRENIFKRVLGVGHPAHQLVIGVGSRHRISQRHDNPAVRNMPLDALAGGGNREISADLADRQRWIAALEVAQVPAHPVLVVRVEKVGLLDPRGQPDVALEPLMQPSGAGARRPYRDEFGKPRPAPVIPMLRWRH